MPDIQSILEDIVNLVLQIRHIVQIDDAEFDRTYQWPESVKIFAFSEDLDSYSEETRYNHGDVG